MMTENESKLLYETHDVVVKMAAQFASFLETREDTCPTVKERADARSKAFDRKNVAITTMFAGMAAIPGLVALWITYG